MMTPRSSPDRVSAVTKALGEQPQHVEGADQIDVDDADKLGQRIDTVLADDALRTRRCRRSSSARARRHARLGFR